MGGSVDIGAYESPTSIAPQLTITSSGTNVIFAWPTNYAEVVIQGDHCVKYFLQSTTDLVSPVAWTIVYPMPVASDGQLVVTNAIDGTQRFYGIVKETGSMIVRYFPVGLGLNVVRAPVGRSCQRSTYARTAGRNCLRTRRKDSAQSASCQWD